MTKKFIFYIFIFAPFIFSANFVWSHTTDDHYLSLNVKESGEIGVVWGIPMWTLKGIPPKDEALSEMVLSDLSIADREKPCPIKIKSVDNQVRNKLPFLRVKMMAQCPNHPISKLNMNWTYKGEGLEEQKMIVYFQSGGQMTPHQITNLSGPKEFNVIPASLFSNLFNSIANGFKHIWQGLDHILFLLALLLPAVFFYQNGVRQTHERIYPVFISTMKTVTAFTLAHSLTLALVTLKLLPAPGKLVEVAIAASILVASVNNLKPFLRESRWQLGFVFGLIHGMGFAEVLVGLQLPKLHLTTALLGYNLGVELGQLLIVIAFVSMAYLLRHRRLYKYYIFKGGSLGTTLIAAWWMVSRLFAN